MSYKIYSDGAATMIKQGNDYLRGPGGWGYVILDGDNNEVVRAYGGENVSSNNAMELTAIRNGLQGFFKYGTTGAAIEVLSDSAYCVNIFTQWINSWKHNGWTRGKKHEPIENVEIIREIDVLIEKAAQNFCEVRFVKVKGHAGNEWNEVCDKLAVQGKTEDACHGISIEITPAKEEESIGYYSFGLDLDEQGGIVCSS